MQEVRDFPRALPNHLETCRIILYFCTEKLNGTRETIHNQILFIFHFVPKYITKN